MKILFLHGLESSNQSSKVCHMHDLNHEVLAPNMKYRDNDNLYEETLSKLLDFKPKLIVGSSMGGYFAYHLGTHFKSNLLLLNPALPQRSFEPHILPDGNQESKIWALLGKRDDIVDPIANEEILKRVGAKVTIGHHQHRTPIEIFEPYFKCVTNEIHC